jgi:hypothetical protein
MIRPKHLVSICLFADDTFMYATDRKELYILRKLQRVLNVIKTWCECCNIKIKEDKTQAIYFSLWFRPPETHLTLNGLNIPFVNHVKYLDVIVDKRITWRLHTETVEAKAFRTFIRICSLYKSECLNANIKLTLHKAPIRSVKTYVCPTWELAAGTHFLKLQHL